jgi:hypothetical protein
MSVASFNAFCRAEESIAFGREQILRAGKKKRVSQGNSHSLPLVVPFHTKTPTQMRG